MSALCNTVTLYFNAHKEQCETVTYGDFPDVQTLMIFLLFADFTSLGWLNQINSEKHISINEYAMLCYVKSLQSCPTLCDPIDGSPPGYPIPGILQARTLEWIVKELAFAREVQWNGHPQTRLLRGAQIGTNFLRSKWAKSTQSLENVSTLCPMNSTFRNVAERNTHDMIKDFPYEDIHLKSYL